MEEEDEEEQNEMPDLEEEGEKENEDLCNEGGTTVAKPKKKRKRKDASTEEPNDKKNKTGEKSSEQGTGTFSYRIKTFLMKLGSALCVCLALVDCCFNFVLFFYAQMRPTFPETLRQHFPRTVQHQTCNETLKNVVLKKVFHIFSWHSNSLFCPNIQV